MSCFDLIQNLLIGQGNFLGGLSLPADNLSIRNICSGLKLGVLKICEENEMYISVPNMFSSQCRCSRYCNDYDDATMPQPHQYPTFVQTISRPSLGAIPRFLHV